MKVIPNYIEYAKYLRDLGYNREPINIDENSEIVTIKELAKNSIGTVIDIRCPYRYKLLLAKRSQLLDNEYALVLRMANKDNIEMSPDIRIRILKEKISGEITNIDTIFYKDLTITEYLKTPPDTIKSYDKFYRFNTNIELNREEHLTIGAMYPDINIDVKNVKLSLDIDLWEEE